MNVKGWRLVIGVLLGAAVAAVVLKALPTALVALGMLAGLGYGAFEYKRRKKAEREGVQANALGLERVVGDPFGLAGLPLHLLSRGGSDRAVENVMFGTWGGLDAKVFDFRCGSASDERRYTCALVPSGRDAPALTIEPRTYFTPEDDRGPLRPVKMKDQPFEEGFDVRSADAREAKALLTEETRRWIANLETPLGFEINHDLLLCYGAHGRQDPLEVLEAATGLVHRLPAEPVRAARRPRVSLPR